MFNQNPNYQSPEQKAGIIIFLVFMLIMAMMCYGSTASAQEPLMSVDTSTYISACHLRPQTKSKQRMCTQTWHLHQEEEVNKMTFVVLRRLTLRTTEDGQPIYVPRCSMDHFGCEERIKTIVGYIIHESAIAHVDPWIVASMIWHESRFSPFVESHLGTRGVMQLHPQNRRFNRNRFLHRDAYRNQCKRILGNCQDEVIHDGIGLLRASFERCDRDVSSALTMYNSGRCTMQGNKYTESVLNYRNDFLALLSNS